MLNLVVLGKKSTTQLISGNLFLSINQSFIAHNTENKCKCYATQYEPDGKA